MEGAELKIEILRRKMTKLKNSLSAGAYLRIGITCGCLQLGEDVGLT
jgi:hypothetical protein